MIDFLLAPGHLITPLEIMSKKPGLFGNKEDISLVTTPVGSQDKPGLSMYSLEFNISSVALIAAVGDATKAREPWLDVSPENLPRLKQKYETASPIQQGRPAAHFAPKR